MSADAIVHVRPATAADQAAIEALVLAELLNPNDLDWRRFLVAVSDGAVIGAVQMRLHADGSCELGSLVVAPSRRGQRIAARLVERLLAEHAGPVHLVTARANAPHYRHWGFRPIAPARAPHALRRNRRLGQLLGGLMSLLRGRRPRRLVILERAVSA